VHEQHNVRCDGGLGMRRCEETKHNFCFEATWEKVFGISRRKLNKVNNRMALKTVGLEDGSL